MAFSALCLMLSLSSAATLTVTPDRSQFFQYDQIILTCVTNSSGWKVMRTIKNNPLQECQFGWAIPGESSCTIEDAYPTDTGVYWCQSKQGDRSNRVNLTVAERSVILESPSCPVFEGENVTLGCSHKEEDDDISTSDFEAAFYKDDVFIGKEKRGKITIKAEEGFYKCVHPSKGESPKSWLAVKARVVQAETSSPPPPPPRPSSSPPPGTGPGFLWKRVICGILLFILYNIILILCIYTYRKWARAKTDMKRKTSDHLLVN